jgi:hypothetical protein
MRSGWQTVVGILALFVVANGAVYMLTEPGPGQWFGTSPAVEPPIDPRALPINRIGLAGEIEADTFTGPSLLSLEMRENVDFLLTPALIVQGAITEGDIVTYPEE